MLGLEMLKCHIAYVLFLSKNKREEPSVNQKKERFYFILVSEFHFVEFASPSLDLIQPNRYHFIGLMRCGIA